MTRFTAKSVFAIAACATFAALAPIGSAQAGRGSLSECRKWVDTGEDMRCFDCYQLRDTGLSVRWVNICSAYGPYRNGLGPN
jgi:hypothetical protein